MFLYVVQFVMYLANPYFELWFSAVGFGLSLIFFVVLVILHKDYQTHKERALWYIWIFVVFVVVLTIWIITYILASYKSQNVVLALSNDNFTLKSD